MMKHLPPHTVDQTTLSDKMWKSNTSVIIMFSRTHRLLTDWLLSDIMLETNSEWQPMSFQTRRTVDKNELWNTLLSRTFSSQSAYQKYRYCRREILWFLAVIVVLPSAHLQLRCIGSLVNCYTWPLDLSCKPSKN